MSGSQLRGPALLLVCWAAWTATPRPAVAAPPRPSSPQQVLASFRVDPGLKVELVAAEPEIESPVFATFDEQGRLWVVEYRDYPDRRPKPEHPAGRIKVLEDRDGDGRPHLINNNGIPIAEALM